MKARLTSLLRVAAPSVLAMLIGCTEPPVQHKHETVRLRFDWISNCSFLGDFAAQRLARADSSGTQIELQEAGMGIDPIRMVITGESDIGIASFEQILQAIDKGADLVIIGQINETSPTVFITPESLVIKSPTDIYGKRVGINPGGATEYVYRSFISLGKLDPKQISEVPADYDLKGWINGAYDVRLAFAYVEPLLLDQAGVKYNVCHPDSFGVRYPGRFYFVNRDYLKAHRASVQDFINLASSGWKSALAAPSQPITDMHTFSSQVDTAFEAKSFALAIPYYRGHDGHVLAIDTASVLQSTQFLNTLGVVKQLDYSGHVDVTLVHRTHTNP